MFSLKNEHPKYFSYKGRKTSKRISLSKKKLLNKIYNDYSIDKSIIRFHNNKNFKQKIIIPDTFERVNLEIGFGDGEFLINNAISNSNELFIGIEVYLNGIAKVLKSIFELKLKNIILSNLNGFYFLEAMPCRSVDRVFIINPDPWKKKRHNKRRLMSEKTLILLTKVIKSKNSIFLTTDSELYLRHTKKLLNNNKDLVREYQSCILQKNHELWGISRYQRKAIDKKGKIYLIIF